VSGGNKRDWRCSSHDCINICNSNQRATELINICLDWQITGQRSENIINSAVLDVSFRSRGDSKCGCDERGNPKGKKEWKRHGCMASLGKNDWHWKTIALSLQTLERVYDEDCFIQQYQEKLARRFIDYEMQFRDVRKDSKNFVLNLAMAVIDFQTCVRNERPQLPKIKVVRRRSNAIVHRASCSRKAKGGIEARAGQTFETSR
jgi:hypothetical protein